MDATPDETTDKKHLNVKTDTFYVLYNKTMTFSFEILLTKWALEFLKQLSSDRN